MSHENIRELTLKNMEKLTIKGLSIAFPDYVENPTDEQIIEWFLFHIGLPNNGISLENPLYLTNLCDCEVKISEAFIGNKQIEL